MKEQWVIVDGDPINGYRFIGPFAQFAEAVAYAKRVMEDPTWIIAELQQPCD